MGVLLLYRVGHLVLGFFLIIPLALRPCYGNHTTVEVEGFIECAHRIPVGGTASEASSDTGPRMNLVCKSTGRDSRTLGAGEVDHKGNFKIKIFQDKILKDQVERGSCFLKLDGASGVKNVLVMIFKSIDNVKQTSAMIRKLKFSSITCTSTILWPYDKKNELLMNILPLTGTSFEYPHQPSVKALLSPKPGSEEAFSPYVKTFNTDLPLPASMKKNKPSSALVSRKLLNWPVPFFIPKFPFPIFQNPSPVLAPPVENLPPTPIPTIKRPLPPPLPHFDNPVPPMAQAPLPPPAPEIRTPPPQRTPTYKTSPPPVAPVPTYRKPIIPPPMHSPGPILQKPNPPPPGPTCKKSVPLPHPPVPVEQPNAPLHPPISPKPTTRAPTHSPGPILRNPNPPPGPTFKKSAPPPHPPEPVEQPNAPLHPPISPKPRTPAPTHSPGPNLQKPNTPPVPTFKKSAPPPRPSPKAPVRRISPIPMSHPSPTPADKSAPSSLPTPPTTQPLSPPSPRRNSFSPIPKAPPIPKLPPIPKVPRKYFNSPKSGNRPSPPS